MGGDRQSASPERKHRDGARRERDRDRDREHRRDKDHDGEREHRHRRERDRSRDRDRERERDREHRRHRDRDDKERDRDHKHREDDRERRHGRDETDEERRARKLEKREREERRERERKGKGKERRRDREREDRGVNVVDDDEAGMWVEKDAGVDVVSAVGTIPTADSLPLKTSAIAHGERSPPARATQDQPARDSWMLPPDERGGGGQEGDFFSSLGTAVKRKEELKPEAQAQVSKYELNTQYLEGKTVDEYKTEEKQKTAPGGPGYQWRMMKLRRLYEQAEEQGRPVQEVALERYGSLDEFNDAVEERRFLDDKEARRKNRNGPGGGGLGSDGGERGPARSYSPASTGGHRTPDARNRFVFANQSSDDSRPASRQGFRRPGEERDRERDATPGAAGGAGRVDALKRQEGSRSGGTPLKGATPIPSVFTPQSLTRGASSEYKPGSAGPDGVFTLEQLNRLQAKVLRAKLTDDPDAEALEEQYERERAAFDAAGGTAHTTGNLVREDEEGNTVQVEVLPTLDGQGRLYDVGQGKEDATPQGAGNKRKKEAKFETRDRQGNLVRYNADDDDVTLGELVRQEKFGGGASDMKNLDSELAAQISRDGRFQADLDYMDDNSERLARKRMKTDAMKRAFAINDYKRTKKALDECPFCYQDDRQPLTAVVALGKRTYLCCTLTEELVPGHCLIVPLQHCLSTLEMDDDDWDEVKNFMKCLMQMFAAENKGVVFYETILSFKQQRHTYIECVPLPAVQFADAPGYFRQSILSSESEWSQHKKLIDFSTRPGGFRRMLVPNVPYFMVQFDYRGEKGYGHVIEGIEDMKDDDEDGGFGMTEGDKGEAKFPPYFAGEIIGNILDLEPRLWRRPKRIDYSLNKERARALGTKFQPYNWTVM